MKMISRTGKNRETKERVLPSTTATGTAERLILSPLNIFSNDQDPLDKSFAEKVDRLNRIREEFKAKKGSKKSKSNNLMSEFKIFK